jgi:hypothetical protein
VLDAIQIIFRRYFAVIQKETYIIPILLEICK